MHSMHTLLPTAFGCSSSLPLLASYMWCFPQNFTHLATKSIQALWSAHELTAIYRPTALGVLTVVAHQPACNCGCSDSSTACMHMHWCKLHTGTVKCWFSSRRVLATDVLTVNTDAVTAVGCQSQLSTRLVSLHHQMHSLHALVQRL